MTTIKKVCAIVTTAALAITGGAAAYKNFSQPSQAAEEQVAEKTLRVSTETVFDEDDPSGSVPTSGQPSMRRFSYDEESVSIAYIDSIDQATIDSFIEYVNDGFDVGTLTKDQFVEDHPEIFGDYAKDADGKLLIPWADAQMTNQDHNRQNAAKELGLESEPINDALDFPNVELTVSDVKAIKAAHSGQKIQLEKSIEDYEIAIFKDWLSKPVVFEAFINLMLDQKIGSSFTLRDNWTGPTQFVDAYNKAREDGEGVNHWIKAAKDKDGVTEYYFMTNEYVYDYVIPFIAFIYEQPFSCEVLSSTQHYHLVAGDNDILRKAELANYVDAKASFVWRFLLKDNTVGLMLGDNVRDGRPEIFNYTVRYRPSTTSHHSTKKTTTTTTTTTKSGGSSSSGSGSSTPSSTPTPTPKNDTETKHPSQGSASQGNAPVGGGTNDNSGSGTHKPDQGNSQSSTVDGSQAHAGSSTNTDAANPSNYDQGPAADHTDNGNPPDTTQSENQPGTNQQAQQTTTGTDQSTGQPASTTTETNPSTGQSEPIVNNEPIPAPPMDPPLD